MQAIRTFLVRYWPEALLLLVLLLVLPPFISAVAAGYNAVGNLITAVGNFLRVPQETIHKALDTMGAVIGRPVAAITHAMEEQPILKVGVVAALFVLRPMVGLFVGAWYALDWILDRQPDRAPAPVNVLPDQERPNLFAL